MRNPFSCRLFAFGAFLFTAPFASAQVDYVRELGVPAGFGSYYGSGDPLLALPQQVMSEADYQAGYDYYATVRPNYLSQYVSYASPSSQEIITDNNLYVLDPVSGQFSSAPITSGLDLGPDANYSQAARNGLDLVFFNNESAMILFQQISGLSGLQATDTFPNRTYSLASFNGQYATMITDAGAFSYDLTSGSNVTANPAFDMTGMSSTAFYQAYGANGLAYVLDYGNHTVDEFDPKNAFAKVGSFTLNLNVTTANEPFAIGKNGNFYFGDGLGGGSAYSSTGTYLDSFSVPSGTVGTPYTGASYVSSDPSGAVYVYDSATGMYQYQDISAVPEPKTWALLGLACLALTGRWFPSSYEEKREVFFKVGRRC